jgi:hypothetical protein
MVLFLHFYPFKIRCWTFPAMAGLDVHLYSHHLNNLALYKKISFMPNLMKLLQVELKDEHRTSNVE